MVKGSLEGKQTRNIFTSVIPLKEDKMESCQVSSTDSSRSSSPFEDVLVTVASETTTGGDAFVNDAEANKVRSDEAQNADSETDKLPKQQLPVSKVSNMETAREPAFRRKMKRCLPDGLNEFGFFDYDHYGVLQTPVTAAHKEFMMQTAVVAIDCEMVGVGPMKTSALARVSIVNEHGYCLYDRFVNPMVEITDYRTQFSGIRESDMENATPIDLVITEVADILMGRILVGHSLLSDLSVLFLRHPRILIRDTAYFFKEVLNSARLIKLKTVVKNMLGIEIQQGEHSSIIDAQAALALYLLYQHEWESSISLSRGGDVFKKCNQKFNRQQELRHRGHYTPFPPPHYFPLPSDQQHLFAQEGPALPFKNLTESQPPAAKCKYPMHFQYPSPAPTHWGPPPPFELSSPVKWNHQVYQKFGPFPMLPAPAPMTMQLQHGSNRIVSPFIYVQG